MAELLSLNNPLVATYIFYISILGLKMLVMSVLTTVQRFKNKAFANPEDAVGFKTKVHEDVERVRRAHLNDLENIVVFIFVSFGYIMTNPSITFATMLFRIFTLARLIHTFVYAICVIPQPARVFSWATGYFITIYMAIKSILYFA